MSAKQRVDQQPGFVLHSYPYRETSLIVEVFSRDHGRIGLVAKGARRPMSQLRGVLMACLAITWLNPHVYLDTLVLLGSVSTQFPGRSGSFAAGAISGSFLFFFALGYGARWLRPVFARPVAWRVLEALIAAVMWSIALRLILGL